MKLKLRLSREARRKFFNFRQSQTRIRPGFATKSERQEPDADQARIRGQELRQEPDAKQAMIRGQEPPPRVRRESGQDSRVTLYVLGVY